MDTHKKTLAIIEELQLSARQVAEAIGKTTSVVSKKKKKENYNQFLPEDFEKLKNFYLQKLEKIKSI
ncbi:hypothetical protein ACFFUE_07380 [Bergeyella porcorum]|uniref:hypothetical protein n=1 Tax=Bergeyella porcorum TaxID=1735111 RepID=UPI0035F01A39